MNQFITLALVLCASAAFASPVYSPASQYDGSSSSSADVQQVSMGSLSNLANIEQYLSGANSAPSYSVPASYDAAPAPAYSSSAPAYPVAPAYSSSAPAYAAGPRYSVQPAYATQLYPGQQQYKAYRTPTVYSNVALPVAPSDAVAKLYVPQQSSYSAPSYSAPSSYAAPSSYGLSAASSPIHIGAGY